MNGCKNLTMVELWHTFRTPGTKKAHGNPGDTPQNKYQPGKVTHNQRTSEYKAITSTHHLIASASWLWLMSWSCVMTRLPWDKYGYLAYWVIKLNVGNHISSNHQTSSWAQNFSLASLFKVQCTGIDSGKKGNLHCIEHWVKNILISS